MGEITQEEEDDESHVRVDPQVQKERIRKIISHQKSLYLSNSSPLISDSNSSASSRRSSSSSSNRSSLLELMKVGGMSLGRLFDMEHTSLAAHLKDYSASPITRPIFLWGTDSCEDDHLAYAYAYAWSPLKLLRRSSSSSSCCNSGLILEPEGEGIFAKEHYSSPPPPLMKKKKKESIGSRQQRLTRKRSYKALPRFRIWRRCKGFRLLFKLRLRLKIVIVGKCCVSSNLN